MENKITLEQQVDDLLKKLTLNEKVSLLSGRDSWNTVPIERLGIPSLVMTDGPHGVRASDPETGRLQGPTTCFPTGVSIGASWNPELVERVGVALAEETRGMGCNILLGPCINIVRGPLGGRNFETYSEDPYLAGQIGVAWVKGLQSQGIGASLKHFACNNQETERNRSSSEVDERTLHEIYLPAFETVVKEAQPWTVMCSYNRLNGVYASQHDYLLNKILKEEWGFEGFVVSDWGANHTIVESVKGGLNLEMPGPAKYYGRLLVEAVQNWQIEEAVIDNVVRRILRILIKSGIMDDSAAFPKGSVNTQAHQELARQLAEEAITLLKNDAGVLPINRGKVQSIAVIGPNAATAIITGGGSAFVNPPYKISPLEGLRLTAGDGIRIEYEPGCDNYYEPPEIKPEYLSLPSGEAGIWVEYFNDPDFSGPATLARTEKRAAFWWDTAPMAYFNRDCFSARWTAFLTVPETGLYAFALSNTWDCRVFLDGELLVENHEPNDINPNLFFSKKVTVQKELLANHPYQLKVEFVKSNGPRFALYRLGLVRNYLPGEDDRLERAVALAKRCDVAIIFGGFPQDYESEGLDRPSLDLTGQQDALIRAVAQVNPRTVVVLNAGAPASMPWLNQVPAVVEAYYPGLESGNAIANILFGNVNPSGKLTVTFPKRMEDTPAYTNPALPNIRTIHYGEGIFVGYRHYDQHEIQPLFPFGHGLSYTTFEYSNLQVPESARVGEDVQVTALVKNTGNFAGKEVVQLYVHDVESSLPRPPKELKGFVKVSLAPGETQTVTFKLDARAFSFYDPHVPIHPHSQRWVAEPGDFEILVGSSSRDIRLKASLKLV